MPLTVRLDASLDAALERYCIEHGFTKSHVVQQSLTVYLVREEPQEGAMDAARPSAAFAAFERAGLIGSGAAGSTSADKAAVRRRVTGS